MPSVFVYRQKRKRKDGSEYFDKYYTARLRFGRKIQIQRGTGKTNKREAEQRAKELLKEEQEKAPKIVNKTTPMTMDEMFGQWWMDKAHEMESPETAKYRIKALLKHFESTMKIQHIDGSKVKAYIYKRREEGKSGSTINKELVILKSAMGQVEKYWGQTLQEIDWKDLRQKEKKEHKIFVTPDEIKALISFLPDHIKIAVAWSIYTGSRLNEMASLLRTNYYPNLCIAYVDTKGGGKRSIALSKAAIAVADRSLELIPVNYAYVFDLRGRRKAWERARAKIGRRDIRWHDLRHLTGSWLNNYAKAPSKTIKEIMGHSKLETTDQYIHAANEDLLRQLNQLPKIF